MQHGSVHPWVRDHATSLGVGAGFVAVHAGALSFFAGHNPYRETIFPPCLILQLTGWQCPGCGGTRALFSFLHGDIATSFAMNPIVVAAYAAVGVGLVGVALARTRYSAIAQSLYWIAGSIVLGATVWSALVRNLLG